MISHTIEYADPEPLREAIAESRAADRLADDIRRREDMLEASYDEWLERRREAYDAGEESS